MTAKPDGGPAFPTTLGISEYGGAIPHKDVIGNTMWEETSSGMTLRDYFAVKAMAAIVCPEDAGTVAIIAWERTAMTAYALADAMLAERIKP